MAYVEMTRDFSTVKKVVAGTSFTKRQIIAGIVSGSVGIPVFILCLIKLHLDITTSTVIMAIPVGILTALILYEHHAMGLEVWGTLIYESRILRSSHRPYMTNNIYEEIKNIQEFTATAERILYKGMSKEMIEEIKSGNETAEIKINGKKIKIPMRGKIPLKKKLELERAVKKAKLKGKIPISAQDSVPYEIPYEDGVFQVREGYFTKTIMFEDITYQLLDNQPKDILFERWCKLINYFDKDIHFQMNYGKMEFADDIFTSEFEIPEERDGNDELRKEYSGILKDKFSKSTNSFKKERYLTYGIEAKDVKAARLKFNKIDKALLKYLSKLDCKANILNGYERLELLFRLMHPASKEKLFFNFDMMLNTGLSSKDFVVPTGFSFKHDTNLNADKYFKMGNYIGAVSYINVNAAQMDDRIISDILELNVNIMLSLHCDTISRKDALNYARGNINDVQRKIMREQKNAVMRGFDMDLLPPDLKIYMEAADELYKNLQGKDENLFNVTITVVVLARTRKELENNIFELQGILQNYECMLERLTYQQEKGYFSTFPLGVNDINIKRTFTTNDLGIFIPFTTKELFSFKGQYYGLNSLSNNVILVNRKALVNPNGLIFGQPGFGKSFLIKREILDVFLKTQDYIIILDPEGEYGDLVRLLNGTVIDISLNSDTYINSMEIDLDLKNRDDKDYKPLLSKISFVVSMCSLILGGNTGLTKQEKSCIDIACRNIYSEYVEALNGNQDIRMPILGSLYEKLLNMNAPYEEIGKYLAVSLDRYVNGSLSYFNNYSNVDLSNRIICYNLQNMDKEQLDLAMFIIQEQIWGKVAKNRMTDKHTWVYMDEFHVFLRNPSLAEYSVDIWKRFRKWYGVPTGLTQNIKDLFRSPQIQNILDVTNFIVLLEQSGDDEKLLADHLNLSNDECTYLHTGERGCGLLCVERYKIPFEDDYPKETMSYKVMTTRPDEVTEYKQIREKLRKQQIEKIQEQS